jgi:hypothetical protein
MDAKTNIHQRRLGPYISPPASIALDIAGVRAPLSPARDVLAAFVLADAAHSTHMKRRIGDD